MDISELPRPILPGREHLVELYYYAWELAKQHIAYNEKTASKYYMDEGCWPDRLWLWDTCFMAEFCRYAPELFPGIESLDNFYAIQHDDGYITMTQIIETGEDAYKLPWGRINPPLAAWVEWDYYLVSGDIDRLEKVLDHLVRFDEWIEKNRRRDDGSYWFSDCNSSGMDNSPRTCRSCKDGHNTNFIDLAAQQALAAKYIGDIARETGKEDLADKFEKLYGQRCAYLNEKLWCERDGFYYDAHLWGSFTGCKTTASFWPLLALASSEEQVAGMLEHLDNPAEFNRPCPVPTLSYDNPNYRDDGGYWLGGVWAPNNYMITRGLENYNYHKRAKEIAEKYLEHIYKVWKNFSPHTIWECYSPENEMPSKHRKPTEQIWNWVRPDFVGWSGLGPISMLIENIIGIKVDYPKRKITWISDDLAEHGIENFRFGPHKISLVAASRKSNHEIPGITVNSPCEVEVDFQPLLGAKDAIMEP
jgi:glycogen debranching enzyme